MYSKTWKKFTVLDEFRLIVDNRSTEIRRNLAGEEGSTGRDHCLFSFGNMGIGLDYPDNRRF